MRGAFAALAATIGIVLGSLGIATAMVFVGINPILSVLAATIIGLDVLYYQRRTRDRSDAAMQG